MRPSNWKGNLHSQGQLCTVYSWREHSQLRTWARLEVANKPLSLGAHRRDDAVVGAASPSGHSQRLRLRQHHRTHHPCRCAERHPHPLPTPWCAPGGVRLGCPQCLVRICVGEQAHRHTGTQAHRHTQTHRHTQATMMQQSHRTCRGVLCGRKGVRA